MIKIKHLFSRHYNNILKEPHFWVILFLLAVIGAIYYSLQIYRIAIFEAVPLTHSLVLWEYVHNLNGSLFYIPILYSLVLFWWRGTLIIWFLSMCIILPRILYFYVDNFGRIFFNLFYLSLPLLVIAYVILEFDWREKERKQLAEREKERQNYLDQVFKAQEEERGRVAREIHDDSIQRLTVIAINARLLTLNDELAELPVTKKGIESLRDMVISVSQDLRGITLDLRPTVLDDLGLVPAIRWQVIGFKQDSGIDTQMEISGKEPLLSKKYTINIFRIIQEALNNIRKHAKATRVKIMLQFADQLIKVTVCDNGIGFTVPKSRSELTSIGKLGLLGMQQRAQFLNGTIHIQSEANLGTTVTLQVKPE